MSSVPSSPHTSPIPDLTDPWADAPKGQAFVASSRASSTSSSDAPRPNQAADELSTSTASLRERAAAAAAQRQTASPRGASRASVASRAPAPRRPQSPENAANTRRQTPPAPTRADSPPPYTNARNHAAPGAFAASPRPAPAFLNPDSVATAYEKHLRNNLLKGFGVVAANLATIAGSAALMGAAVGPLSGGVILASTIGFSVISLIASAKMELATDRSSQATWSTVMHIALGANFGMIAPFIPGQYIATAAVVTGGMTAALLLAVAALPGKYFERLEGPLTAAIFASFALTIAEVLLPPHLGVFGTLGMANSLIGLGIGMGMTAFSAYMMAEEAKMPNFNPVKTGAAVSLSIYNVFLSVLEYILKEEGRNQQRARA